jgi:hypothetical protein
LDLCTVISEKFIPQAINLIKSYKVNSFNDKAYVYHFNTPSEKLKIFKDLFSEQVILREVLPVCAHALEPRVFFYKVYAINDCLINHSDSMIYSDSANCFARKTITLEDDLIDQSLFMPYRHPALANQYWTTKKCFEKIEAEGAEIMPQYWAGFQAYKRTQDNIEFVTDMFEHMKDPEVALPDTTIRYPDGKDSKCIEHRQEQSVLSILLHKHDRHHYFDMNKNDRYGDWQTIVDFDKSYQHNFDQMVLSPRESKFGNFRFLR